MAYSPFSMGQMPMPAMAASPVMEDSYFPSPSNDAPVIRKTFPETWIFDSFDDG